MKLVRRILDLERKAGAIGLIWTRHDSRIDPAQLEPGQHIAVDVTVDWSMGDVVHWASAERVSSAEGDLGIVRHASGEIIGRVVSLAGGLVSVEYRGEVEPAGHALPRQVARGGD